MKECAVCDMMEKYGADLEAKFKELESELLSVRVFAESKTIANQILVRHIRSLEDELKEAKKKLTGVISSIWEEAANIAEYNKDIYLNILFKEHARSCRENDEL